MRTKGRERYEVCGNREPQDKRMVSPLVSKVKLIPRADFAGYRRPVLRWKPLPAGRTVSSRREHLFLQRGTGIQARGDACASPVSWLVLRSRFGVETDGVRNCSEIDHQLLSSFGHWSFVDR
jgi:hypothetical protein